jgi:UDP-2,3-diacylglucosamine pyrophosphatase LpxH
LNLGSWGDVKKKMFVRAPERLVFLGDIMELWDASKESVDMCSRSIFQTASKLTCEKIYVLGNHDNELLEISGSYPLGKSSINIVEEDEYAISKGAKKFMFLHGHQFDGLFTLPSWRIMPLLNKMANLLGKFAWFFVALWAIDIALSWSFGVNEVAGCISLIALGAISVPFLAIRFGRELWNRIRTIRYEPEKAEVRLEDWWKELSESVKAEEINVVYGHTHSMSFWSTDVGEDRLTLFNLPSWIRDQNKKDGISLENIFRHGFLYIDSEAIEFVGWDTENKRPFFIPKNLIQERQQSKLPIIVTKQFNKELLQIGWPQKLIDKWFGEIFPNKSLA